MILPLTQHSLSSSRENIACCRNKRDGVKREVSGKRMGGGGLKLTDISPKKEKPITMSVPGLAQHQIACPVSKKDMGVLH